MWKESQRHRPLRAACTAAKAENIAQAIKPFGQVANAFNKEAGRHGLGLPIARSLTELHGGRFVIESELGMPAQA